MGSNSLVQVLCEFFLSEFGILLVLFQKGRWRLIVQSNAVLSEHLAGSLAKRAGTSFKLRG